VATSAALTGVAVDTDGVLDADDCSFSAVTGDSCEAVIVYEDSGAEATSHLISYNELSAAITPDGSDILVSWNASGICKL